MIQKDEHLAEKTDIMILIIKLSEFYMSHTPHTRQPMTVISQTHKQIYQFHLLKLFKIRQFLAVDILRLLISSLTI